jgi:hypothetical protein
LKKAEAFDNSSFYEIIGQGKSVGIGNGQIMIGDDKEMEVNEWINQDNEWEVQMNGVWYGDDQIV